MIRSAQRAASFVLWPGVFIGSMAACAWGFHAGYPVAIWAFLVSAGNVILIVALEQLVPRIRGVSLFRDRQLGNDIGHGILVATFGRTLGGPLAAALVAPAAAIRRAPTHGVSIGWAALPMAAQVALALGLWSFAGYWSHRLFHRVERLWRFHAVHHDTPALHVMKGNRIHVGEDLLRQLWVLVPLYVLGAPAMVLVWVSLWNNFEGALAHSNVDICLPAVAHWILATPQNHVVHHARAGELQDSNFGGVTPLWDILFGTYRHPDRYPVAEVGIDASPVPAGFFAQLAFPLRAPRAVAA